MRDPIAPTQRMTAKIGDNEAELRADVEPEPVHRSASQCAETDESRTLTTDIASPAMPTNTFKPPRGRAGPDMPLSEGAPL